MPRCVTSNVSLAPYTTLNIGGRAEYVASVTSEGELCEVIAWAKEMRLPVTVLGGGSNVLIADEGIAGVVLRMNIKGIAYSYESAATVEVRVAAGEWDDVVREMTEKELWGIENLSGIPGTVGAAPVQNINAYGTSIGNILTSVVAYHTITGEKKIFAAAECGLEYRDSYFKSEEGSAYVITETVLGLSRTPAAEIEYRSSSQSIARWLEEKGIEDPRPAQVREAVLAVRRKIGMLEGMYRSAGSFFKNTVVPRALFESIKKRVEEKHADKNERFSPWHWRMPDGREKISTAFLMECTPFNKTDFRERTWKGGVGISPLHTLSIINVKEATARDVKEFVDIITDAVFKEFGIQIEREVCYLK